MPAAQDREPASGPPRRTASSPGAVVAAVAAAVLVPLAVTTPRFLTLQNGRAILAAAAFVGITAIGATLIMIAGSTVSMAASQTATAVAMVFLATQRFGVAAAFVLGLLCGVAITAVQGVGVGYWDANPVVLTIAAGFAIGGVATWASGGTTVYPERHSYRALNATPLGLPVSVYVMIGLALAAEGLLRRSTVGQQLYLVGANRAAARAAGLPVGRVVVVAWAFFGLCTAVTGVLLASFHTSANASLGGTLTLDVIAAVLVGGTAIAGGRGSALRTLGGTLAISVIANILLLRGFSTGVQALAKGLLVLVVVVLVHLRTNRARR